MTRHFCHISLLGVLLWSACICAGPALPGRAEDADPWETVGGVPAPDFRFRAADGPSLVALNANLQDLNSQGGAAETPEPVLSSTAPPVFPVSPASDASAADELARLRKALELQQQQIQTLDAMTKLLSKQLEKPVVSASDLEKLQGETATLESYSQQAARRDRELADAIGELRDDFDARDRYGPRLSAPLKELFIPTQTNETRLSIYGQLLSNYHQFNAQPGQFDSPEFSPFFLLELNDQCLLEADMDIAPDGIELGEALLAWQVNDWARLVVGRYLTPIGFFNLRLNHEWINRLPDPPLMFLQVSPQLSTDGAQVRGSTYLFGSPVKMEYAVYGGNGMELTTPNPGPTDLADLEGLAGGPDQVDAKAFGTRIGFWIPAWGITCGGTGFHNWNYVPGSSADIELWQIDFGFRKGNWDVRFEYAKMFQEADAFLGHNIDRRGLYTQVAYRPYDSPNRFLANTEFVFRFSEARFRGIDPAELDLTAFDTPVDAPIDRNQYTVGINYWFYPSLALKFAYEVNQETGPLDLNDNDFLCQLVWGF